MSSSDISASLTVDDYRIIVTRRALARIAPLCRPTLQVGGPGGGPLIRPAHPRRALVSTRGLADARRELTNDAHSGGVFRRSEAVSGELLHPRVVRPSVRLSRAAKIQSVGADDHRSRRPDLAAPAIGRSRV